jgi:hypothetical protein
MVLDEVPTALIFSLSPAEGQTEVPQWLNIEYISTENGNARLWSDAVGGLPGPVNVKINVQDHEGVVVAQTVTFNVITPVAGSGINDVTAASDTDTPTPNDGSGGENGSNSSSNTAP